MHAHAQIEYDSTESLIGFNPTHPEDRKLIHDMLDEYLDRLATDYDPNGEKEVTIKGNGFTVSNFMHK